MVAQLDQPVALVSPDDVVRYANASFLRTFAVPGPVEGRPLFDIVGGAFDAPELRGQLGRIRDGGRVHGWRFEGSFPGIGRKVLSVDLVALRGAFFETGVTLISVRDETDRAALESDVARRVQEKSDLATRLGRLRAAETSAATASRILDELIGVEGPRLSRACHLRRRSAARPVGLEGAARYATDGRPPVARHARTVSARTGAHRTFGSRRGRRGRTMASTPNSSRQPACAPRRMRRSMGPRV